MAAPHYFPDDLTGNVQAGNSSLGVLGVTMLNENAAAVYFQLHNAAGDVANAAVPVWVYRVPATSSVVVDLSAHGGLRGAFGTGLSFGWSSTRDTYTAHGTATDVSCIITTL